MEKALAVFGVLMLLPLAAASGAVEISPSSQEACCGAVQYEVTVTNGNRLDNAYVLSTEAPDGIKVSLKPEIIVVPAKSVETLIMIAKPPCGIPPGDYEITIISTSKGACEGACGDVCDYESGRATATLTVPEGCVPPEEPQVEPQPEAPQAEAPAAPTGAAVTPASEAIDTTLVAVLGALLVVMALMLFILKRPRDKSGELFPEAKLTIK